jgi:hypothetical protein
MKRERKDETEGLCTPEPSQDIHGHHRDSGASRNPGEGLLRAGFAVGEGVPLRMCRQWNHEKSEQ